MVKHIFALAAALVHLVLSADSITLVPSQQSWENIFSDSAIKINPPNSNSTHTVYLPNPITLSTQHKTFSHHTSAPHYNLHCMNTQQLAWYFAMHGYTEGEILSNPMLYLNAAYLTLVKQFPRYPAFVEKYHKKYRAYSRLFKIWETMHLRYCKGLAKQFERLYLECENKRCTQEAYERKQREIKAQEEQEARAKKEAKLREATTYCAKLESLAPDKDMDNAVPYQHQQVRNKTYAHIKTTVTDRIAQEYIVACDTINFAQNYSIAEHDLKTVYGNIYEHHLHTEFLEQLNEIRTISTYYALKPNNLLIDAVGHGVAIGMEANRLEQPDTATAWANFGWKTLKIIEEIGEGLLIWAENTTHIIINPVSSVGNILYGLGMLVYGGAYAVGCTARTAIRLNVLKELEDYETYADEINHINNNITALRTYCTEKLAATSNEDLIKHATVLTADIVLTPKILMFAGTLCAHAVPLMRDALVHIKSRIPHIKDAITHAFEAARTESPVLHTAEGMLMKASEGLERVGGGAVGIIKASRTALETVHAEYMAHLEVELGALRSLFDSKVKGFAEFANKFIKIEYKHILGIEELTWQCKELLKNIKGFHHDFMNTFKNSGILEFTDQVMYEHGFYRATVLYEGKKVKDGGTFFPAEWSRRKVIEKIQEAYENFVKSGALPREKGGKYMIDGFIAEGIKIRMYITKNGVLKTAFPLLE